MRVLHLPTNIASQISVTVRALRDVGVEARGILWRNAPITDAVGIETFDRVAALKPCEGRTTRPVKSLTSLHWSVWA